MLRQVLSAEVTPFVAATFVDRVEGECEARARFARLARELEHAGADRVLCEMALQSAEDEHRHAHAFARWALEFGKKTDPDAAHAAPPVGAPGLSKADRVLLEVVSLCCLAETLAAAVLGAALDVVSVPVVRDGLHSILRDEVRHSKLGWAYLAAERHKGRGDVLAAWLPALLDAGVPSDRVQRAVWPVAPELGLLAKDRLFALLAETMNEVILPGFELHDIDTSGARAWLVTRGFA